jgi:hypothetical protein
MPLGLSRESRSQFVVEPVAVAIGCTVGTDLSHWQRHRHIQ